ncbi:MAG: CoA transferase [Rhizomicrobium sp.]|jgi:crotonobetainyl-CoA:carnitine CoA-transferase CaiB-like acyl-CoA transferase
MTGSPSGARPLNGIRVADFTSVVAGPWCTRLLADCGALVVKIESTGDGDILRHQPPVVDGLSLSYAHYNCGKESVSLDLKTAEGRAVAHRLIAGSDIVVENYRPGVMKRFGLDYDTVARDHPKLIYCSISGFGQTGALAERAAYAPLVHAYSGFDSVFTSVQGGGAPPVCGVMIADVLAAAYAFGAIQTALIHRERNGLGSHIDVSLMESAMSLVALQYQAAQSKKPVPTFVFEPIKTSDGYVMVALVSVKTYLGVYPVIGHPQWTEDAAYNTLAGTMRNRSQIMATIAEWASTKTATECERLMSQAGVPCSIYCSPAEQLANPYLIERGAFQQVQIGGDSFSVQNAPFKFSSAECTAGRFVARAGQHNENYLVSDSCSD